MTAIGIRPAAGARLLDHRSMRVVRRNAVLALRSWPIFITRLFEPYIFLFSIGIGVGTLVGDVIGPDGTPVPYRTFVAPAMLAGSAMNASVFATVIDFFAKFKWRGSYEAMLASPIGIRDLVWGELLWILAFIGFQSASFAVTMLVLGLIESWWALLLVPAGILVAFAFGGVGFVAASFLRSWLDFDLVTLVIFPLFLFSASFFPLSRYPDVLAWIVQVTPLYHGVDLARDLTLGTVDGWSLVSVCYLLAMGLIGMRIANRRIAEKLQP
ncbi:MAG: ABC transporter permease [Actinomycetota bacterium]